MPCSNGSSVFPGSYSVTRGERTSRRARGGRVRMESVKREEKLALTVNDSLGDMSDSSLATECDDMMTFARTGRRLDA